MSINRLNGTSVVPLYTLGSELDRMFDGFFGAPPAPRHSGPRVSIWEQETAFYLEAEVPGVAAADLEISVVGNLLTLKGSRSDTAHDGATVHRHEWRSGEFERSFELPVELDEKTIEAKLELGILRLTLPKAPQHQPHKVKIVSH